MSKKNCSLFGVAILTFIFIAKAYPAFVVLTDSTRS